MHTNAQGRCKLCWGLGTNRKLGAALSEYDMYVSVFVAQLTPHTGGLGSTAPSSPVS